jgi:hypothetical protein
MTAARSLMPLTTEYCSLGFGITLGEQDGAPDDKRCRIGSFERPQIVGVNHSRPAGNCRPQDNRIPVGKPRELLYSPLSFVKSNYPDISATPTPTVRKPSFTRRDNPPFVIIRQMLKDTRRTFKPPI